jgi:hypothetical protein
MMRVNVQSDNNTLLLNRINSRRREAITARILSARQQEQKSRVPDQGPIAGPCRRLYPREYGRYDSVRDYTLLLSEVKLQKKLAGITVLLNSQQLFCATFPEPSNFARLPAEPVAAYQFVSMGGNEDMLYFLKR